MAKVSVLWSIVFLVAFLVAGVAFFLASGEMDNQKRRADALQTEVADLRSQISKRSDEFVALSQTVGFVDPLKGNNTDPDTVKKGLASLKEAFPDLGASVKTIQDALPILAQSASNQKQRIGDLEAQLESKSSQIEELQKGMRDAGEKAATEAADLRRQVADSEQKTQEQQADYERRIAELQEQVKDRDAKWRQSAAALASAQKQHAQESDAQRTRMSEMGRKLQPFLKEPEQADGHVLSVSKVLGAGWIDLGAKNRLPLGTRFTVAAADDKRVKAVAEVRRIENDMAEVAFVDQRDPFDPPAPGDVVWNPVYDPRGERYALLIGGFSGKYAEDQLKGLLVGMGVKVQKGLDNATDFLIVGNEQYVDENGQPVETPIQPMDLPVYKEAVAQGVQVVLLKDLRNYFRY
jgi:predicted  nucleic acid-binding Zn-ribbon protein